MDGEGGLSWLTPLSLLLTGARDTVGSCKQAKGASPLWLPSRRLWGAVAWHGCLQASPGGSDVIGLGRRAVTGTFIGCSRDSSVQLELRTDQTDDTNRPERAAPAGSSLGLWVAAPAQ